MDAVTLPDFTTLWDFNDPAGTEDRFNAILPQAEASGNADYHAQLLTQIARTHGLRRDFAQAHAVLDQADALIAWAQENAAESTTARTRSLLERGRTLNWQDEKPRAEQLFREAYALAMASGNERLAIDAAHMVAIVGDLETQIEWAHNGLAAARSATDPKAQGWEGPLLNNLGWTYFNAGRIDEAYDMFQQSLEWRRQHGPLKAEYIARWTIARCLRGMGKLEESLAIQETLRDNSLEGNPKDGYVFEEIGECQLALGRPEAAALNFAQAYALLSADPALPPDDAKRLPRIKELAGN
jgi:tetratricopeptide (TPR) repeat protein